MAKLTLHSKRTNSDYPVEVYFKDECTIIRHTSLEQIFYGMEDSIRPEMAMELLDLGKLPKIPPMFAVKCILEKDACIITQIGELTCQEWESSNEIKRNHPLTTCQNIAFDRAFIRYMQFDISEQDFYALYSESEIPYDANNASFSIMGKNVNQSSCSSEESVVVEDVVYEENYVDAKTEEGIPEESVLETEEVQNAENDVYMENIPDYNTEDMRQYYSEEGEQLPDVMGDEFEEIATSGYAEQEVYEENAPFTEQYTESPYMEETENWEMNQISLVEQQEEILEESEEGDFLDAPMPEGTDSGITTLPWFNPQEEDSLDASWEVTPPYGWEETAQKIQLEVYGVKYDKGLNRTKIVTDDGLLFYDRGNQRFEADQLNLEDYDLDALYHTILNEYHIDLNTFDGATGI